MKEGALSSDKDPAHRKKCTLCTTPRDVLVRCQIDDTDAWHFVCTGKCWKDVSGGKVDADAEHPWYRYGGMWKNKHEAVSAKKPKGKRSKSATVNGGSDDGDGEGAMGDGDDQWHEGNHKYTRNDRVRYDGKIWTCRRSHRSEEDKPPDKLQGYWKELLNFAEEDSAS